MSLEKDLRGAWDRARTLLTSIEAARDHHAAGIDKDHVVGFEIGSALGELHLLEHDLISIAEDHFLEKR